MFVNIITNVGLEIAALFAGKTLLKLSNDLNKYSNITLDELLKSYKKKIHSKKLLYVFLFLL